MKGKGTQFEIIFVSSDRSEDSFKQYLSDMPWQALPYDYNRKDELSDIFDVEGNAWI